MQTPLHCSHALSPTDIALYEYKTNNPKKIKHVSRTHSLSLHETRTPLTPCLQPQ